MFVLSESLIKNSLFRLRKHLLCSTTGSSSSPSVLNDYPRIRQQPFSQEKECILTDDTGIKNGFSWTDNVILIQPLCALAISRLSKSSRSPVLVRFPVSLACGCGLGTPTSSVTTRSCRVVEGGAESGCEAAGTWPGESQVEKSFFLENSHFFQINTSRRWRGGPTQPQCCPSPLLQVKSLA